MKRGVAQRVPATATATARAALAATISALIALTVTGCGHRPPTRYFTLDAAPADAPLSTAPPQCVQLTAVHIPAEHDRPEVVTQVSPNRLSVGKNDRWRHWVK